jgi:RHS repeat-associated protein
MRSTLSGVRWVSSVFRAAGKVVAPWAVGALLLSMMAGPAQAQPWNLTATAVSQSRINLTWTISWDPQENPNYGTRIQRWTSGNPSAPVYVGFGTSFGNTGLSAGTTYSYCAEKGVISTVDGEVTFSPLGSCSNPQSATTWSIPAAPSGLSAAAVSGTQINIAWTDNSNNETEFRIERKTGSAGTYAQITTVGANVTAYSNTGLANGTTYFYRVRASNSVGNSAYSNQANATTQSLPGAPTGLTASAVSNTEITLNWTDASTNETGFRIERKTGAGGTYGEIALVGVNATSYNNTGLASGVEYYYRIRATNNVGDSGYSNEASATTSTQLQAYYVFTDHLNTPRLITNQVGQPVWKWDNNDPFGGNVPDENPSGLGAFTCNLRFPGQYFDQETGLHYNYFRDCYDPATGRYCQFDPIGLAGGINGYSYVRSSPLSATDPLGLLEHFLVELNSRPTTTMLSSFDTTYTVYSGNPPYRNQPDATSLRAQGPLPEGTYYIVDRPMGGTETFLSAIIQRTGFALYRRDALINDATFVDGIFRNQFRLHAEGPRQSSEGCIVVLADESYKELRKRLLSTRREAIPGTSLLHYGTITVYQPAPY